MLYPKCPKCGGKAESATIDPAWAKTRVPPSRGGEPPVVQLARLAFTAVKVGREAWKRIPGGGGKRCKECGHRFS